MNTFKILIFILLFSLSSCYKPPTQKKITKSPVYTYLPKDNIREIEPGLFLEVTKVDPSDLDQDTYEASSRYSSENEIFTKTAIEREKQSTTKERKFPFEKAFDAIDWLESKQIIDHHLAIKIKQSYSKDLTTTEDIGTTTAPSETTKWQYPSTCNPYRANRFTMFRIQAANESNEIKKIQLSNFIISCGYEQLQPLSIKYFDTIFLSTSNEYQNILRFNMPNELLIPKSQKVVKYLAVPIIDERESQVTLTLISDKSSQTFNFQRQILFQGGTYNYIYYKIDPKTFFTSPNITVVIKFENELYLLDNPETLWIYENDIDKPVDIFCFTEVGKDFEFGKIENIKLSEYKSHVVPIKLKSY